MFGSHPMNQGFTFALGVMSSSKSVEPHSGQICSSSNCSPHLLQIRINPISTSFLCSLAGPLRVALSPLVLETNMHLPTPQAYHFRRGQDSIPAIRVSPSLVPIRVTETVTFNEGEPSALVSTSTTTSLFGTLTGIRTPTSRFVADYTNPLCYEGKHFELLCTKALSLWSPDGTRSTPVYWESISSNRVVIYTPSRPRTSDQRIKGPLLYQLS